MRILRASVQGQTWRAEKVRRGEEGRDGQDAALPPQLASTQFPLRHLPLARTAPHRTNTTPHQHHITSHHTTSHQGQLANSLRSRSPFIVNGMLAGYDGPSAADTEALEGKGEAEGSVGLYWLDVSSVSL